MKRLISMLLATALLPGLLGCQGGSDVHVTKPGTSPTEDTEKPHLPHPEPTQETLPQTEPTETTAPPDPLPEPQDHDLVRVLDYIPQVRQELPYATVNNFSGQRIYDFTDTYLRYGTVKKLAKVCLELAGQGLGLKIWDGFRPVAAQAALWDVCPDPNFVSPPVSGNRPHCRGGAVDVTLVDLETGAELPMPTAFDDFTANANRDYTDCSPEAAQNATLLEQTMEKHGFKPYFGEWWHFSDTDVYPIDMYFDPAFPTLWAANCEEYISLRETPGGSQVLARIPAGEAFTLQQWDGIYAKVAYGEMEGYVLASYIRPENDPSFTQALNIVRPTATYSYDQLLTDIAALQSAYPELVKASVIGISEQGREIPVLRIGSEQAKYHVLLQGAIHGREHMTAWLLMAMADYWLTRDILSYGDICYHIIPMSNPDGVVISQTGALEEAQLSIYRNDQELEHTALDAGEYAALWKANALGVDLNRNFPAGWEFIDDRDAPSSEKYQGEAPFSAAETRALREYTLAYDFDVTVSYHATGSLIYYEYGEKQTANERSESLGRAVSAVSGYPLEGSSGVDGAGYKDWAIDTLEIPSLTIEIGCQSAPLHQRELYSIFARNYRVLPAIARWLQK